MRSPLGLIRQGVGLRIRQRVWLLALGFPLGLSLSPGVASAQGAAASPSLSRGVEWVAHPSELSRIARVETKIPAVVIEQEAPVSMTVEQWMKLFKIPGLSVAVFDKGQIVWAKAYGVKEAGGADPVTIDTLFQAGSISKPVGAMAVLHFVEAGRFSLDENINDKLISWKLPDNEFTTEQKATLRRLLSHSAGTTVHGFPGYAVGEAVPTLPQVLNGEKPANTAPVRVDIAPGTKTRYSGGGTTIVQLMMVDQLKKPFPEIMRETVIDPIGLKHSSYEQPLPPDRAAMTATGTDAGGKSVEGRWHIYPEMQAAGLWTTASDLARIAIEVSKSKAGTSNRVLSQAMTRQMLTPQSEGFGLGFAVDGKSDRFGHNGADEGFQALLVAFADSGSGVAIMANSDNGLAIFDRVAASVAAEYGWKSYETGPASTFIKLSLLTRLKGADKAVAWYKARQREGSAAAAQFNPGDLNRLGYGLLRDNPTPDDALKVFLANTEIYPQDANAYDSLGEAYVKAGKKEAAIASYRKSLQLDAANPNAVKMLEQLGAKPQP
jgi:CubicO group peptidase (beta-lactamase class C family)